MSAATSMYYFGWHICARSVTSSSGPCANPLSRWANARGVGLIDCFISSHGKSKAVNLAGYAHPRGCPAARSRDGMPGLRHSMSTLSAGEKKDAVLTTEVQSEHHDRRRDRGFGLGDRRREGPDRHPGSAGRSGVPQGGLPGDQDESALARRPRMSCEVDAALQGLGEPTPTPAGGCEGCRRRRRTARGDLLAPSARTAAGKSVTNIATVTSTAVAPATAPARRSASSCACAPAHASADGSARCACAACAFWRCSSISACARNCCSS